MQISPDDLCPAHNDRPADRPCLLLISSNESLRQALSQHFVGAWTAAVAATEEMACQQAAEQPPDLLVIDREARFDGDELLARLRSQPGCLSAPVLWLIDSAEPGARARLLQPGLSDYLIKPFLPKELLGRAQNLLALSRPRMEQVYSQERVAQLVASENNFRLMVESIEEYAMFMVDLDGRITSWNRGAERLTGYSEHEALGRPFSILYPSEDLDPSHAAYELAMAKQHGRYEEEGVRVRKDGTLYNAQILIWRLDDEEGCPRGFAKITRDVTARRQAEQALRESEAKFRTIADAMPQMVWSTLPNGYHDYYNQQWYRFTGVPEGSTDGEAWNDMFHPEDQPRAWKAWRQSLASGEPYEIQYRLRHRSGEYRWTLGRALPVRNQDGAVVRWMGTCTDIHDQKLAEEALQEASRHKDEFLAMLAHELRNPLAPIQNSAQLIRRLAPAETTLAHALDVIDRQVRHVTRLVDDLLDVARISRGKIQLRTEPCELAEIVRHTLEDYRASFEAAQVDLQLHVPSDPLWVNGDRTRIAQMIGNLLHNALKFTESRGCVEVSLTRQDTAYGAQAAIEVRDTGVGIEPDLAANLFNPFIQASQGLARSQGGLGLGLALVKGFAELHGGTAFVESQGLGRGASFTVQLPLTVASPARGFASGRSAERGCLRIVLIDDNRDMADTLQTLLSLEGHEVMTAYDGPSGIAVVHDHKPDVIICDIGLPGETDGYAVARAVRAEPACAKVVMVALTGYGQDQDRRKAHASGFDMHLLKPIGIAELEKVFVAVGRATSRGN